MATRYFWGTNIHGKVTMSPAASFQELVQIYVNVPVTLPIAQESYHSLEKKERNEIKTTLPYLVPAVFKTSPSARKIEEARHCNLIFLDIDVAKDGSCPAAPLVSNPAALSKQLAPFAFCAYTTVSSTPDQPRMRVMVNADAIPLEDYAGAVATIAERIGLPLITAESKVTVQPMFLPSLFNDQIADLEHPLIASDTAGRAFTVNDIVDIEEMAPVAKSFASQPQQHGDDALAYLRPPVAEITLEIAEEALSKIDPDLGYMEWLEIAASLKHQFSPKRTERAYQIFDEWSSKGDKYSDSDDTLAKWNSLQPTPKGRAPVTIRTLLHRAVEHGWASGLVKEKCFGATMVWINDPARTSTELMSESLVKIAGTPLLTHTEEDALLNAVVAQAKRAFNLSISTSSFRKDLKKLKDAASRREDTDKPEPPPWLRSWCYVAKHNEFFRHNTFEKLNPEQFNNAYSSKLLPTEEQLQEMGQSVTPANLSKPTMRPQDFALNYHGIQVVYDYRYDPAKPNKLFTKHQGRYYVNTYRKSYPEASKEGSKEAGRMVIEHMRTLVEEEEYWMHILDWVAFNVQYPGRKIRHALLIQGAEGCGKTFLFRLLSVLLGLDHASLINSTTIAKGWNEWAVGKQVTAFEEIRVVGHNRFEVMNALKELITNDYLPINERSKSTRMDENITNYLLFSNFHDAIALTDGDRRYFVIMSRLQTKSQVKELEDKGYFVKLFSVLTEHASGLRYFFENYKIRDCFRPDGHAPRTKYAEQMINDVKDEFTSAVQRFIEDATHPLIQEDLVAASALSDQFITEDIKRPTSPHLASILRGLQYTQVGRFRCTPDDGKRQYIWAKQGVFPRDTDFGAIARSRMEHCDLLEDLW